MTSTPIEEKIILQQVAEGHDQAFRHLYDQYSPRIYSLGMYLTHSTVMAEELVQDIFEKLWTKRQILPGIDNFPAYVRAMVRNTANSQLRRIAHERLILKQLAYGQPAGERSTEAALEQEGFRKLWTEAIDQLSPRTREVYLMSRQEGLKNGEIAERLGISIYTVKEHLQKALASIRTHLDGRLDLLVVAALITFFP